MGRQYNGIDEVRSGGHRRAGIILLAGLLLLAVAGPQLWKLPLLLDPVTPQPSAGPVVLYGTTWCPYCEKTRAFLDLAGVPYVDLDIEHSPAAEHEFKRLGGRGVPLLRVGDQLIHGYSPQQMRAALEQPGPPPP